MRKSPAALEHKGENTQGVWNAAGSCYSNKTWLWLGSAFTGLILQGLQDRETRFVQGMGVNSIHLNLWAAQIFQRGGALKWQHTHFAFPTRTIGGVSYLLMPPRVILSTHKPLKCSFNWFIHDFPGSSISLLLGPGSPDPSQGNSGHSAALCQADHSVCSVVLLPSWSAELKISVTPCN